MRTQIANFPCIVENPGQSNAVLMFHGFGADYSDLVPLAEVMDPEGDWTWIFPDGPIAADIGGGMTGRAWFPIDIEALIQAQMTGVPRNHAESSSEALQKGFPDLEFFIEEVKRQYPKIVLGGFSQGGMVATHLFKAAGDHLVGALLLSTVLYDSKILETRLENVAPKKLLQTHGSRDTVLPMQQGQALYQNLKKKGWKTSWLDFPGGHEIPMSVIMKSKDFLKSLLG